MTDTIREAEETVLTVLESQRGNTVSMKEVIQAVNAENNGRTYRAVEVKIAAMNLVSQGRADLSSDWELRVAQAA